MFGFSSIVFGIGNQAAIADDETFSFSSGSYAASADFALSGSTLTVTLTNMSAPNPVDQSGVLTGVFFNSSGLTPLSASLNGSTVVDGSLVNNVGEGWTYQSGVSAQGMNSGISAAGLGIFSQANFFSPPVTPLDGVNYGILSAGYTGGSTGFTNGGPYIDNSILFTLTAPTGFNLGELGSSVVFQYGSALTEPSFTGTPPSVPEPSVMLLLGFGMVGLVSVRRLRTE